jgi:hypothetical protein
MASYAMGLSMITSAAEQLGAAFAGADTGISGMISTISSLLMGIMFIIPAIGQWIGLTGTMLGS